MSTYQLCRLLESEFDAMLSEADKQHEVKHTVREALHRRGDRKSQAQRDTVITYNTFLDTYWTHFLRYKCAMPLSELICRTKSESIRTVDFTIRA